MNLATERAHVTAPAHVSALSGVPTAPIAILAVVVLASLLSGYHGGLFVLVPVLAVLLVVRRLAGGGRRRCYRDDRAS
jgi:hypothetical protein